MSVFHGVGAAMITPFDSDGVNFDAFGSMIEYLIDGKIDSLIVCGTTGEPATMTADERRAAIAFAVKKTGGRVPVIAGCGCNSTAETVANARAAQSLGADALLVVTPYYNKCTQNGLVAHYTAVAEAVDIPVIVYNVPSRTGVNLLPSTMLRLSDVKNIVGIKEASGNIEQLQELVRITRGKTDVYLGEDSLTYLGMTLGSKGVISVAANVAPLLMREITENAENGNYMAAREAQLKALPLIRALFSEVNPIPVKKAMNFLGFDAGVPRLPLTEMEEAHAAALYGEMQTLGLVK